MSYKVLARKWRPQHFRDLLGQEPVLRALTNALDNDRLHHAYLFTGMRGVGKTTIARIFAKCLNCETNGVSSSPCGQCSACQDIEAGRFFDLIEVDAASRTKVESTRELLENVPYAPASGRFKVYLIDEVHMFSNHSFNALLKTLEEPPEHVKFLLATTDPQKVPSTVLSRCLQFNLRRLSSRALVDHLGNILQEEGVEFETGALDLIASSSEGSVRDSLSLVEQAAAFGGGRIEVNQVEDMLGKVSINRLIDLLRALADGDIASVLVQVETLAEYAPDFHDLMGEILSLLHRVSLLQMAPRFENKDNADDSPEQGRLREIAALIEPDTAQLFYQIGLHARRDMPFAPDAQGAFEMALLRMYTFRPAGEDGGFGGIQSMPAQAGAGQHASESGSSSAHQGGERPGVLPVKGEVSAGGVNPVRRSGSERGVDPDVLTKSRPADEVLDADYGESQGAAPGTPCSTGTTDVTLTVDSTDTAVKQIRSADVLPDIAAAADGVDASRATGADGRTGDKTLAVDLEALPIASKKPADTAFAVSEPENKSNHNGHVVTEDYSWPQLISELGIAGMPMQLAANCELLSVSETQVILRLQQDAEHLNAPRFVDRLQSALSTYFGRSVKLSIQLVEETLQTTPAAITEQKRSDELAAARASIHGDPIVQQLIDRVDGSVDEASVRPIKAP